MTNLIAWPGNAARSAGSWKHSHLEDDLWPIEVLVRRPKVPGDVGSICRLVVLKLHRQTTAYHFPAGEPCKV